MKRSVPVESASRVIDERINELGTGAGRRSPKCAKSYTRPTLRSSKGEKGKDVRYVSFGVQSGPLDAKGGQNFCGHLRAPWNTRRISTALLRTR